MPKTMRSYIGTRQVLVLRDLEADEWEIKIFLELNKGNIFKFRFDRYNNIPYDCIGWLCLAQAKIDNEGNPYVECIPEKKYNFGGLV